MLRYIDPATPERIRYRAPADTTGTRILRSPIAESRQVRVWPKLHQTGWGPAWINRQHPSPAAISITAFADNSTRMFVGRQTFAAVTTNLRSIVKTDLTNVWTQHTMPANFLAVVSLLVAPDDDTLYVGTLVVGAAKLYRFVLSTGTFTDLLQPTTGDRVEGFMFHPSDPDLILVGNQAGLSDEVRLYTYRISSGVYTQVGGDGIRFGWNVNGSNKAVIRGCADANSIYVAVSGGTVNELNIWQTGHDMLAWTRIGGSGLNSSWATGTKRSANLGIYQGLLYASLGGGSAGDAELWRYNGSEWGQIGGDSINGSWAAGNFTAAALLFDKTNHDIAADFIPIGLTGTANGDSDIWMFEIATDTWTQIGGDGILGSTWGASNIRAGRISVDREGRLWVGPSTTAADIGSVHSIEPLVGGI